MLELGQQPAGELELGLQQAADRAPGLRIDLGLGRRRDGWRRLQPARFELTRQVFQALLQLLRRLPAGGVELAGLELASVRAQCRQVVLQHVRQHQEAGAGGHVQPLAFGFLAHRGVGIGQRGFGVVRLAPGLPVDQMVLLAFPVLLQDRLQVAGLGAQGLCRQPGPVPRLPVRQDQPGAQAGDHAADRRVEQACRNHALRHAHLVKAQQHQRGHGAGRDPDIAHALADEQRTGQHHADRLQQRPRKEPDQHPAHHQADHRAERALADPAQRGGVLGLAGKHHRQHDPVAMRVLGGLHDAECQQQHQAQAQRVAHQGRMQRELGPDAAPGLAQAVHLVVDQRQIGRCTAAQRAGEHLGQPGQVVAQRVQCLQRALGGAGGSGGFEVGDGSLHVLDRARGLALVARRRALADRLRELERLFALHTQHALAAVERVRTRKGVGQQGVAFVRTAGALVDVLRRQVLVHGLAEPGWWLAASDAAEQAFLGGIECIDHLAVVQRELEPAALAVHALHRLQQPGLEPQVFAQQGIELGQPVAHRRLGPGRRPQQRHQAIPDRTAEQIGRELERLLAVAFGR